MEDGKQLVKQVDLDKPSSYEHLDPAGMLRFAIEFPEQVKEAAEIGRNFKSSKSLEKARMVVLSGMGGSAIAGDFLASMCEERLPLPFLVNRGYQIPQCVDEKTLFIASSHSGNTEETLAATTAALRRGAGIICITTGGKLREFAERHANRKVALLKIPQTDPPMPPRAALGYSFIPLVRLLENLGFCCRAGRQIAEAISLLEQLRERIQPEVPTEYNRAKQLALCLQDKLPWIQGTIGIMSAAAYRWRTQLNENSKMLSYSSEYPELNHNEVIGWEKAERYGDMISVVMLRSPGAHWRVRARVDITKKKIIKPKAPVHLIEAEGQTALGQLLWTVYLGDWVSLYLALLNNENPASIDSINTLKADLVNIQKPTA